MLKFILQRVVQTIPVLLIIAAMTFFMAKAIPGGPFSSERKVAESTRKALDAYYGLDQPVTAQFFLYLKKIILHGDLGPSFRHEGRSVNELIADSFPVSLELGCWALSIALGLGLPMGLVAAVAKNTWMDYSLMSMAMIGICLPSFVVGPLLALVFGLYLGWFNVSGWFSWSDRVLPACTIGLYYAAYVARLTRGGMLEVLAQDYIRTARAKGCPEWRVVLLHALRGGLIPVVSYLGPAIAGVITGSFVSETIFQIPGLGRHFVNAVFNRDYTMIMGTVLFYGFLIVIMNLIVDILLVLLNPKLKFA